MQRVAIVIAEFGIIAFIGFIPSAERIAQFVPYVQVPAFTFMAVNHGLQAAKRMKEDDC